MLIKKRRKPVVKSLYTGRRRQRQNGTKITNYDTTHEIPHKLQTAYTMYTLDSPDGIERRKLHTYPKFINLYIHNTHIWTDAV